MNRAWSQYAAVSCLRLVVLLPVAASFAAREAPAQPAQDGSEAEAPGANIQWSPVPGAREYLFEVRDAQKSAVLKRTVKQPQILVRLPEGSYEMRSRAVDRFRRNTPWSDWAPLRIRYAVPPEILSVSPEPDVPAPTGDGPLIELRGKNFVRESQVELFVNATPVGVREMNFVDADTLQFSLNADAPEGRYDVTVVNPGDVRSRLAAAFAVKRDGTVDPNNPTAAAEPGPNRESERERLPAELASPGFAPLSLIPGMPDFARGRYARGALWLGGVLGSAAVAVGGFQAASAARDGASANSLYPSFSNPVYLYGLATYGTGSNFAAYSVITNQVYNDVRGQYATGRSQYVTYGGVALALYFTHLAFNAFAGPDLPEYQAAGDAPGSGFSFELRPPELFAASDTSLGVRPQRDPSLQIAWSLSF